MGGSLSELINAKASRWMKRGIGLLTANTPETLRESLRCFDEAIRLRRTLPLRENAWYRYVLAAGWMNRADALTRLGALTDAVSAYDEALAILQTLDLEENPLFRRRLALAWMNRGVTLQQQGSPAAVRSFENAVVIAREPGVRAASLTNYGNALLQFQPGRSVQACQAFQEALSLLADTERAEFESAEICLNARRGICRAIAFQLTETNLPDPDLVSTATDAVEDALNLARHWERRGENRFRELALEMVDFGARAYRLYQPQFVTEFLTEMSAAFEYTPLGGNQFSDSFFADREHRGQFIA